MQKQREKFILNRFTPYMGKKKVLLPLSLMLSGISAILNVLPFVFVWYITRNLLAAPRSIDVANVGRYAWLAFGTAIGGVVVYFFCTFKFSSCSLSSRGRHAKSRNAKNTINASRLFR